MSHDGSDITNSTTIRTIQVGMPQNTVSTDPTEGRRDIAANSEGAEKAKLILVRAIRLLGKFVVFVYRSIKNYIKKQKELQKENERQRKISKFRSRILELRGYKNVMNPDSFKSIETFEAGTNGNPEALAWFADHRKITSLLEQAKRRSDAIDADARNRQATAVFEISTNDLFSALGQSLVDPILSNIVRKYKVSNAGNVVAGGILAGRKNYGGAALSLMDSARVGAHNGEVSSAFKNHIRLLKVALPAANCNEQQRSYIIYAFRLLYLGHGDRSTVMQALFGLIFNNGYAMSKPPTPHNKFSQLIAPEFSANFGPYIWTVQQSIVQLDQIRMSGGMQKSLFDAGDLSKIVQNYVDATPQMDEFLGSGRHSAP